MRDARLISLGAAVALTALAQDTGWRGGISSVEFFPVHSPCGFKHDASLEKVLQVVRIAVGTATPPKTGRVATFEMRNNSQKTITSYVVSYTYTHGGRTDYYGPLGEDLVYEMALAKYHKEQAAPNSNFPPGGVLKKEIWRGGVPRQFEVYPCAVAFEDGTAIGPPSVLRTLANSRSNGAKAFAALIADLELARSSVGPKAALMNRAKQLKRRSTGRVGEWPYAYLEIVARELSGNGSTPRDRKIVADHISALRAQQEMLSEQARLVNPK